MTEEGFEQHDLNAPRKAEGRAVILLCSEGTSPPAALIGALNVRGQKHVCVDNGPQVMALLNDGPVDLVVVVQPHRFKDGDALVAAIVAHYPAVRVAGLGETGDNGSASVALIDLCPARLRREDALTLDEQQPSFNVETLKETGDSDDMHRQIHQSVIRELHGDVDEQGGTSSPWLSADEMAMLLGHDEEEVDKPVDIQKP